MVLGLFEVEHTLNCGLFRFEEAKDLFIPKDFPNCLSSFNFLTAIFILGIIVFSIILDIVWQSINFVIF